MGPTRRTHSPRVKRPGQGNDIVPLSSVYNEMMMMMITSVKIIGLSLEVSVIARNSSNVLHHWNLRHKR